MKKFTFCQHCSMFEYSKLQIHDKHVCQKSRPPETSALEVTELLFRKNVEPIRSNGCRVFHSREFKLRRDRRKRRRSCQEHESYADRSQLGWSNRCPDSCQHEIVRFEPIPFQSDPSISVLQFRQDDQLEDTRTKGGKDCYKARLCDRYFQKAKIAIRRQPSSLSTSEVSPILSNNSLHVNKLMSIHSLKDRQLNNFDEMSSTLSILLHKNECSKRLKNEYESVKSLSSERLSKVFSNSRYYNNSGSIIQLCNGLSIEPMTPQQLPTLKPYQKTLTVYSVYDQKFNNPQKNKRAVCLSSGTSFSIQFYRNMDGDGEQKGRHGCRNSLPFACSPSYTSIDMANVGRDEDGCICLHMPPEPDYDSCRGGSFLKRYLRVLMREQRRCMCGKKRFNQRPCPNKRRCNNVGCQSRCKHSGGNFRANDAACQCKCKEKIEQRPDRDIFCKDRGTTCCAPKCKSIPENFCKTCLSEVSDQPAVNIGSNFSFQMGFVRRCFDNRPGSSCKIPTNRGGDDCCCSETDSQGPKSASIISFLVSSLNPRIQCKRTKIGRSGDNCCCCSQNNSNDTLNSCCCSTQNNTTQNNTTLNSLMSWWKSTKNKSVGPCKCEETPIVVQCSNTKNTGVCCSASQANNKAIGSSSQSGVAIKSVACYCDPPQPITVSCSKRDKNVEEDRENTIGSCCCGKKGIEKQTSKKFGNFFQFKKKRIQKETIPKDTIQKETKEGEGEKSSLPSACKCDQKKYDFDYTKVISNMTMAEERRQQTRVSKAQQCACKEEFDYKKAFGRLLLFNAVPEPICCSRGDPYSKGVGFGEEDLRKPPCRQKGNYCPGIGGDDNSTQVKVKNFFGRFIKPNSTSMQYQAFNPLNKTEASIQHTSREGPIERAGREVICRNQGSCAPKARPMTVKECEAMPCPALQDIDPNRKAVRIGSNLSFVLEFYRGLPPAKKGPQKGSQPCPAPPCAPPCPPPCPRPPPVNYAPVRDEISIPKRKCKKCVKVPLIKRGFQELILSNQIRKKPKSCRRTNTLQPNRKLVVRKPDQGRVKCDPYVCLKRINQTRQNDCCK